MKTFLFFIAVSFISGLIYSCERPKADTPLPLTVEETSTDSLPQPESDTIQYALCPLPACESNCLNISKSWLYMFDSCRTSPLAHCSPSFSTYYHDDVEHEIICISPDNPSEVLLIETLFSGSSISYKVILVDICEGSKIDLPSMLQNHSEYALAANGWIAFKQLDGTGLWRAKLNGDSLEQINTSMLGRVNDQADRARDERLFYSPNGKKLLFFAHNVGYVILDQDGTLLDSTKNWIIPYGWSVDGNRIYAKYDNDGVDYKAGYWDLQSKDFVQVDFGSQSISGSNFGPGPKPELLIWEKFENSFAPGEIMMMNIFTGESSRVRQGVPGISGSHVHRWHSAPDGSYFCATRFHVKELSGRCRFAEDRIPHFFAPDCTCEIIADFD